MVELNGASVPAFATYIRNTDPGSIANLPGLSIPLAVPRGNLPAGVEIDGPEGSDRRLLAIGAAIERLLQQRTGVVDAQVGVIGSIPQPDRITVNRRKPESFDNPIRE